MSHLKRGNTSPAHFKGNLLLPFSSSFSTWAVQMNNGLAMGQPEPRDTSERKTGREQWSKVRSEEKKSRVQTKDRFFRLSASAANTSFQTQTYTPVMECKYLDMGKVGCYLIPPFKDVLFRWTWSNEYTGKYSECFDTTHENLILMSVTLLLLAQWRPGLTVFCCLPWMLIKWVPYIARNHWICAEKNILPGRVLDFTFTVFKSFSNHSFVS